MHGAISAFHNMLNRTHVTLILFLSVLVWGGTLALLGYQLSWSYFKPFTVTVTVVTLTALGFDKWSWRWRIFKGWLVNDPDLQGTWKALLISDWIDPGTGYQVAPIKCVVTIRQ